MRWHWMMSVMFCSAMAWPSAGAAGRYEISRDEIASAIRNAGLQVTSQQIALLTSVTASTSTPALHVESMERWGDHQMRIRLGCRDAQHCLPFFVVVQGVASSPGQPEGSSTTKQAKLEPGDYVIHSGSPATLLIDGDRIHIRLSVVCMEKGAPGQTIRVVSRDNKKVYRAEVVNETVLRGRL